MSTCDAPGLTPLNQAKALILSKVTGIKTKEQVPLAQASGRVLAADVLSLMNVPPYDNSAMDGYALALHDKASYQLVGSAYAGHPYDGQIQPGQCIRIMTGAPVPIGADLVEMQENAELKDGWVQFSQPLKTASNIRLAGEDIALGSRMFSAGHKLKPADCGLIASVGIADVEVFKRPKVAFFTTGDELVQPGAELQAGQIYESNSYVIKAFLADLGVELVDIPAVKDDLSAITQALSDAALHADMIITCGGVSVGEADLTRKALEQIGQLDLWKLAIKPGKPLAFGAIGETLFLGLPGNPVSAFVTMQQIGQPIVQKLAGEGVSAPLRIPAKAGEPLRKRPGRTDFQRGIAEVDEAGNLIVKSAGRQGSGILTSVSRANCLIVLEQERGSVAAGEALLIEML